VAERRVRSGARISTAGKRVLLAEAARTGPSNPHHPHHGHHQTARRAYAARRWAAAGAHGRSPDQDGLSEGDELNDQAVL
jgi:hypothetical protein